MQTTPLAQTIANQANLIFVHADRMTGEEITPEAMGHTLEAARHEMTGGDTRNTEAETGLNADQQEAAALVATAWVILRRAANLAGDESLEWAAPTE